MNIIEIIEQKYENLTRKQKQIADYMRNHAAEMCFMTLKELSERVEVSEMIRTIRINVLSRQKTKNKFI